MFDRYIIVHTHNPKCGGGSINAGLQKILGPERVLLRSNGRGEPRSAATLDPEDRREVRAFAGHFEHGFKEIDAFGRTPLYIASVREPFSRLASTYAFMLTSRSGGRLGDAVRQGQSYDEAVRLMMARNRPPTLNNQCLRLCGEENFEAARRNAEADYLAVVTHDNVDALLRVLGDVFGAADLEFERMHARDRPPEPLAPETEALVRSRTAEDARLAAWVAEVQAEWLDRAAGRLRELAAG